MMAFLWGLDVPPEKAPKEVQIHLVDSGSDFPSRPEFREEGPIAAMVFHR